VPSLSKNVIHVWQVCLSTTGEDLESLLRILSVEERLRAAKFIGPELQGRFVIAHAALRLILSNYCHQSPERIGFKYGEHGKPALDSADVATVEFNLSHSTEIGLIAVSQTAVGIDVERYRLQTNPLEVGRTVFSPVELQLLEASPPEVQGRLFFDLWTRKEALLKAMGCGLLSDPTSLTATEQWPIQSSVLGGENHSLRQSWTIQSMNLDAQYSAAVSGLGTGFQTEFYQWHFD